MREVHLAESYGALVRSARRSSKLTLGAVATYLGVSVSYVSDVEHGYRSPFDAATTIRIAGLLHLDPETLLKAAATTRGAVNIKSADPVRLELAAGLARHLEHLTPSEIEEIQVVLRRKSESR